MKSSGCLLQNDKNYFEKHYVSQSNLTRFGGIGESTFSLGKAAFCNVEKGPAQNIMNTVVYEEFCVPLRESDKKGAQNY